MKTCWIYAFVDLTGILYVGQSCDLYREQRHRKRKPELAGSQFKVIRKCDSQDAFRLERQIILACKRKGQARLNKYVPKTQSRSDYGRTLGDVACSLEMSLATLKNYMRGGYLYNGKFRRYSE